jgi:NADPH:quinone reductase-like Zn-dependent oxidoreductase
VSPGSGARQFTEGDEVFGYLPSATGRGTFAEFVCADKKTISLSITIFFFSIKLFKESTYG